MDRCLLLITILAYAFIGHGSPCYAGWVSGGGEIESDEKNPWFLMGREVRYCILIDEANFGASADQARTMVNRAWAFWRNEFTTAGNRTIYGPDETEVTVELASQTLLEVDCKSDKVDLHIQLGVLDADQERYLRDPRNYVGVAVRTDYDVKTLQGKGFVYISPETGRFALNSSNNEHHPLPNRWTVNEGQFLFLILCHEFGHVFGIEHEAEDHLIMGAGFPSSLVEKGMEEVYLANYQPNFFRPTVDRTVSLKFWEYSPRYTIFGIERTVKNLLLRLHDENRSAELIAVDATGHNSSVGWFKGMYSTSLLDPFAIRVYATLAQHTFPFSIPAPGSLLTLSFYAKALHWLKFVPNCKTCARPRFAQLEFVKSDVLVNTTSDAGEIWSSVLSFAPIAPGLSAKKIRRAKFKG